YLAFFADNYGALPPNTANFIIGTIGSEPRLYSFDFSNRSNAFATVMVSPFPYTPPAKTVETTAHDKILETDTTQEAVADVKTTAPGTVPAPSNRKRHMTAGRRDIRIGLWQI